MKSLFKKLNESKIFRGLNPQEFAWVLYDVGNSAYTMLACSLIPIWFKNLATFMSIEEEAKLIAEKGLDAVQGELAVRELANSAGLLSQNQATSYYATALSIVTLVIALLGPVCGALADHKDTRKIFFTTTVAGGVIACVINGFTSSWMLFIIVYVFAKIFYQASLTFYDSMLNDVTTDDRADEVSSYGYAWGYIGSCIPFIVALVSYILTPGAGMGLAVISDTVGRIIGFGVTAAWWMLVTLPLIKNYKQINYVEEKSAILHTFTKLFKTVTRIIKNDKKVLYFLLAFFLYIDGVGTIIDHCINLGTALGLNTVGQVVFLLLTQVVAWGGSLVFAKLSKKKDTISLIKICIIGYTCVCLYALTLKQLWQFAVMAFGVGCFQGSIQSLSRSYFSKIIPDENSGEYFGIYDIFSKGASALGSVVISVITAIPGGNINIAVGSLAAFFILGYLFITMADKQPQSIESMKDILSPED